MESKKIIGIIFLIISSVILVMYTIRKLKRTIKAIKLKYKDTVGKVVNNINTSDPEYQKKEKEEIFKKNKHAKNLYEILNNISPPSEENIEAPMFASVIQYEVNNKKYEIISDFSSEKREKKNKKYKIKYNPSNPSEAFIANDRGTIIMFFVVLFLAIGLILLFL